MRSRRSRSKRPYCCAVRDRGDAAARAGTRDHAAAVAAARACRDRAARFLSSSGVLGDLGSAARASAFSSRQHLGPPDAPGPRGGRCSGKVLRWPTGSTSRCVGGDEAGAVVDLDRSLGSRAPRAPADQVLRHRVAVGVDADVALDVDDPLVEQVDLRDPQRQGPEVGLLGGEQLPRARLEVALEAGVDLVAPRPRLGVGVGPVREPRVRRGSCARCNGTAARREPSGWRRPSRGRGTRSRSARRRPPSRAPAPCPCPSRGARPRACCRSCNARTAPPM